MRNRLIPVLVCLLLGLGILFTSLSIRSVRVTGNETVSAEEIEARLFPTRLSRNTAVCLFRQQFGKKENIPFVQDYKVSFLSPSEVEIIVYEKSLVGYVSYMSSFMYFDKDGIVVESARHRLPGIPEVTGLSFGQIVLYRQLPVESPRIFAIILNLTQTLSTCQIPADRISYDREMNATLTIGSTRVLLGDAQEMNGKLTLLANMLPSIESGMPEGRRAILDLRDYDPTDVNRGYSLRLDS